MIRSALPTDELAWLRDLLITETTSASPVGSGNPQLPSTIGAARTFAASNGRRYVYPTRQPFGSRALLLYTPVSWRARVMRQLLHLAMRTGVERYFLSMIDLPLLSGEGSGLIDYLAEAVGVDRLQVAIALGTPGPQRKAVLLLMDEEGGILGFAKVGCSRYTSELVANEHGALELMGSLGLRYLRTPRVRHFGNYAGNAVLVTEPLTALCSPSTRRLSWAHVQALLELARHTLITGEFAGSRFRVTLDERLRAARSHARSVDVTTVTAAADVLCSELNGVTLPWSFQLGDFAPWNMAVSSGEIVELVDLEYATAGGLPAWDLFHFLSVTRTARRAVAPLSHTSHELLASYFDELRISRDLIALLHLAYLVDLHLYRIGMWRGIAMTRSARSWLTDNDVRMNGLLRLIRRSGSSAREQLAWQ